jgi:hypothetical protein
MMVLESKPRSVPPIRVNVDDQAVTLHAGETQRFTLDHALESICAFEIDETDEFFESGWSVVAVGGLELATEEDFASMR